MKTKLTELAKRLNVSWAEAEKIRDTKLEESEWTGRGKNTWLTPEAVHKFELAVEIPPVVPEIIHGYVIRQAYNPNYVYASLAKDTPLVPVAIPRRLHGKLIDKKIPIHAITDAKGTSYRHATLTGHYNR